MTDQGHIVDTGRPRLVSDLVWDSELDQATDPSDQEAQTGLSAHCSMAAPSPTPPGNAFPRSDTGYQAFKWRGPAVLRAVGTA